MNTKSKVESVDQRLAVHIEYFERESCHASEYVVSEQRQTSRVAVDCGALLIQDGIHNVVIVRDISATGIGLSHEHPIPLGIAKLSMTTGAGTLNAEIEIIWCHTPANKEAISGAQIVRILTD